MRAIFENTKANNPNPPRKIQHALSNFKEFVAELSNPALRQELKAQGVLEKIADVILEFFNLAGVSDVSKAKKALMDLLEPKVADSQAGKMAEKQSGDGMQILQKMDEVQVIQTLESSAQKGRDMLTIGKHNFTSGVL